MMKNSAGKDRGYNTTEVATKGSQTLKLQPIAVPAISVDELKEVTDNFGNNALIGEGSYGRVYYGILRTGQATAIKKLDALGMFSTNECKFFIATMPTKVFDENPKRNGYTIALNPKPPDEYGLFIHSGIGMIARLPENDNSSLSLANNTVIGVVKKKFHVASKVLDEIPEGVSHMTTRGKGTLGYLAQEYAMWEKVPESCDVYRFGIMLLEIFTGRKPIEKLSGGEKRAITEWAKPLITKGKFKELVDPKLRGNYDENQLKQAINVAAKCMQSEADKRPKMKEVADMLKGYGYDHQVVVKEGGGENNKGMNKNIMRIQSVAETESSILEWVQLQVDETAADRNFDFVHHDTNNMPMMRIVAVNLYALKFGKQVMSQVSYGYWGIFSITEAIQEGVGIALVKNTNPWPHFYDVIYQVHKGAKFSYYKVKRAAGQKNGTILNLSPHQLVDNNSVGKSCLIGAFIFLGGVIVYLFLTAYPEDVGFPRPNDSGKNEATLSIDEEAQGCDAIMGVQRLKKVGLMDLINFIGNHRQWFQWLIVLVA